MFLGINLLSLGISVMAGLVLQRHTCAGCERAKPRPPLIALLDVTRGGKRYIYFRVGRLCVHV